MKLINDVVKSLIYFYGNQAMLSVGENATPIPKATAVAIQELEAELAKKIQHLKDADYCGDIAVKRYQKAEARLERVLDAEIPWEYGMMKLRHTAVVKAALKEVSDG